MPELGSNCFQRYQQTALIDRIHKKPPNSKTQLLCIILCKYYFIRGTFFYVRREVDLMKTAKVNAYIVHIFGKIELLSIHAT